MIRLPHRRTRCGRRSTKRRGKAICSGPGSTRSSCVDAPVEFALTVSSTSLTAASSRSAPGFVERREDLAVEQFVPALGVEALAVAVLPGTTWFDEQRLHPHFAEPVADRSGCGGLNSAAAFRAPSAVSERAALHSLYSSGWTDKAVAERRWLRLSRCNVRRGCHRSLRRLYRLATNRSMMT